MWAAGLGLNENIKVVSKPTHLIQLIKKDGYYESRRLKSIV